MPALITAEELQSLLEADLPPLLLDVRWTLAGADRDAYAREHVPGAVFCDLDGDLALPPGEGGRHPLPPLEDMRSTFARLGVSGGRLVVAYDGGRGPGAGAGAARAWWCLRWVGHGQARVLDGGLAAWLDAGLPVEAGEVAPTAVADTGTQGGPAMPTVSAAGVRAGHGGRLVDARAPERFRGEKEPIDPVAGHIPGAVNVPVAAVLEDDGRYLAPDRLREVLGPALAGAQATAYCGSGVTAAQLVLAAHEAGELIGLYPGSWSDWIRDPDRPVATGG